VALTGSQKGLMLPPGLGLVCAGLRALSVGSRGGSPRNFFDWRPILEDNEDGFFPYTPAIPLIFGLREALAILFEEGLENVFIRHRRLAEGVRAAVGAWGLANLCEEPLEYSNTLTAVVMPEGHDSQVLINTARERFELALGVGLSRIKGRVFRIGHLGSLNELEVLATLAGVEMALVESGLPVRLGSGLEACQRLFLAGECLQAEPPG
jgi:alanine-glyoxylate transaminase / serine-glyoxylate transaminase / serine-pyruvate transaminase